METLGRRSDSLGGLGWRVGGWRFSAGAARAPWRRGDWGTFIWDGGDCVDAGRRCALPGCYVVIAPPADGGPQRKYCTPAHRAVARQLRREATNRSASAPPLILQELPEPPLADVVEAGPVRRRRTFSDVAGRRARAMAVLGSAGLLVTGGTLAFSGSPTSDSTTAAPWLAPDPEAEQNWASEANVTLASLDRQLREIDQVEKTWNSLPPQERGDQTPPDVAALAKRRDLLQQQRARLADELGTYQSLRAAKQELGDTERHVAGLDKALAEAQQDRHRASSGTDGDDTARQLRERRSAGDKLRQEQRKKLDDLSERVREAMSTPLPSGDHATRTITAKVRDLLENPSRRHSAPAPEDGSPAGASGGVGSGGGAVDPGDSDPGRSDPGGDATAQGELAGRGGILGRGDTFGSGRTSGRGGLPSASGALKHGGLLNPGSQTSPSAPSGAGARPGPETVADPGAAPNPGDAVPKPGHVVPNPEHAVPNPEHAVPNPEHAVPSPGHAVPNPENAVGRGIPPTLGGAPGRGRASDPGAGSAPGVGGVPGAVTGQSGAVAGPSGPLGHVSPRSHRPDVLAAPATPELHDSITQPREGVGDRTPGGPLEGLTGRRQSGPRAAASGPVAPTAPGQNRQRSRTETSPLDTGQDSGSSATDGPGLGADRPGASGALPRLTPRQARPPASTPGSGRSAPDLSLGDPSSGSRQSSHQSAADEVIDALPFGAGVKQMARSAVADEIKTRQRKGQLSGGQSSGSSSSTATQRIGPKKSSSFSMDDLSSLTQSYASKYSSKSSSRSSSKSGSRSGAFQTFRSSSSKSSSPKSSSKSSSSDWLSSLADYSSKDYSSKDYSSSRSSKSSRSSSSNSGKKASSGGDSFERALSRYSSSDSGKKSGSSDHYRSSDKSSSGKSSGGKSSGGKSSGKSSGSHFASKMAKSFGF